MNNTFKITSGKVTVSDPCYRPGTPGPVIFENVKNGKYIFYLDENKQYTNRSLIVIHEDYTKTPLYYESGFVDLGVDSGQLSVVDGKYYEENGGVKDVFNFDDGSFYSDCCHITNYHGVGVISGTTHHGVGVVSETTYGDGSYQVDVARNEVGKIIAFRVYLDFDGIEDYEDDMEYE